MPSTIAGLWRHRGRVRLERFITVGAFGPAGQAELLGRAGGNPDGNAGVDYARQLAKSSWRSPAQVVKSPILTTTRAAA
ncbi:hypothetical protein [Fodinicola acaciae]|uniref:hypothetical protein n=1 Tax=Fodinicola acaciae TaxID=2681555 RepID=UPI0013D7D3F4|nr:hypothetical protein [Fodinicola acaciae]